MRLFKTGKAASTTEMGLLIGLIAVGVILAVQGTGLEISKLFGQAGDAVGGNVSSGAQSGDSFDFTSHTFTPCGQVGASGPDITQCRTAYSSASWAANSDYYTISVAGFQVWTVPETATYRIRAAGAVGGRGRYRIGGDGAAMQGDFALTQGDKITIVVGQAGTDNTSTSGGGGGGSFVWRGSRSGDPLIAAGGGGGGGYSSYDGLSGVATTSSTMLSSCGSGSSGGAGGTSHHHGAGGGAGWLSSGGSSPGRGGSSSSFIGGGQSGYCSAAGGFGGGGCSTLTNNGAGGGGGYSGGGSGCATGGDSGGGGGSFNAGSNQANASSNNSGQGSVTITKL